MLDESADTAVVVRKEDGLTSVAKELAVLPLCIDTQRVVKVCHLFSFCLSFSIQSNIDIASRLQSCAACGDGADRFLTCTQCQNDLCVYKAFQNSCVVLATVSTTFTRDFKCPLCCRKSGITVPVSERTYCATWRVYFSTSSQYVTLNHSQAVGYQGRDLHPLAMQLVTHDNPEENYGVKLLVSQLSEEYLLHQSAVSKDTLHKIAGDLIIYWVGSVCLTAAARGWFKVRIRDKSG